MIRTITKLEKKHKSMLTLGLVVLIYSIGSGAFEFFLPILAEDLVGNIAVVGFLLSLPSLVGLLIDMPLGGLSDKLGRRTIIALGLNMDL